MVNNIEVKAKREDFQTTLKGFVASLTNLNNISNGEDKPNKDNILLPNVLPPPLVDVLDNRIELNTEGLLSTTL